MNINELNGLDIGLWTSFTFKTATGGRNDTKVIKAVWNARMQVVVSSSRFWGI